MSNEVSWIYSVPADDFESFLDSLTPAASDAFSGMFQPGSLDGEDVYFAYSSDSFQLWFQTDLPEEPGTEKPNDMLLRWGGEYVQVMVTSGYFGGDFISA